MARRFFTLDVFTETPLAGNPLAVVLDSDGLDDAAMLAIAREFNLSETVFVSPPADAVNTAAMRIFTPGGELPFAGHPTVGTAVLLADLNARDMARSPGGVQIALEQRIGLVKVEVSQRPGRAARGLFTVPKLSERLEWVPDMAAVTQAVGLDPLDIGFAAHGPSAWSAGVPFVMLPVRDLAAIGRAGIADAAAWQQAFSFTGRSAVYLYTMATVRPESHVHARMFAPKLGVPEDPATGSAVAAFAGAAVAFERPEPGWHQLIIEQGYEMGRPSEIVLDIEVRAGLLTAARIGGAAVIISEGKLKA
jgi:trans-2,3-dihydro-3-hydroxyanthranilate isomerase